ncbi:MAG: MMPL family transporter [Clostridia bacterium]|nr:MMPL family transporter [Clostridia bacterium]
MEGIARFIVKYRIYFTILFIALALVGAFCSTLVNQNYDLSKYLPSDSETTQGLAIMKDEFGLSSSATVMVEMNESEVAQLKGKLSAIDGVQLVTLGGYKDGSALLNITLVGDEYSQNAQNAMEQIKEVLDGMDYALTGGIETTIDLRRSLGAEMPIIMAIAIVIILAVLFATSHSWIEPLLIGIVLLCAVLINIGSNIIFGEISYVTFTVSAILQLALSLDYSIILLHAYNAQRVGGLSSEEALIKALAHNMKPISSSGLTTIAGLIALFFMSYTIGFDIGIVLAKGILISLLCVIMFMPALIIFFGKALSKTEHKAVQLGGTKVAKASVSMRKVLPAATVVIIVLSFFLQMGNTYTFGISSQTAEQKAVEDRFGSSNQAVVIVNGDYAEDVAAQTNFAIAVSQISNSQGNTIAKSTMSWGTLEASYDDLIGAIGLSGAALQPYVSLLLGDDQTVGNLYRLWQSWDGDIYNMVISKELFCVLLGKDEFDAEASRIYGFLDEDGVVTLGSAVTQYGVYAGIMSDYVNETVDKVLRLLRTRKEEISAAVSNMIAPVIANAVAEYGENASVYKIRLHVDKIFGSLCGVLFRSDTLKVHDFYDMLHRQDGKILQFVLTDDMLNAASGTYLPEVLVDGVRQLDEDANITVRDLLHYVYTEGESLIQSGSVSQAAVSACSLIYLFADDFDVVLSEVVASLLDGLKSNFVGAQHGRIVLVMDLPKAGEDTFNAIDEIKKLANQFFGTDNCLAGESVTYKDIAMAFDSDLLVINIITVVSILLIVAVLFRSLLLPIILVLIIQGGIWITMAVQFIVGNPIFFMSYIICMCIQMGATIDYGILISSNYRRNRATMDRMSATVEAVRTAMPTILTSGTILVSAGFIIGFVSSIMPIYSIGRLLGLGAIISILLMIFLLPAVLYLLDKPISATTKDGIVPKD